MAPHANHSNYTCGLAPGGDVRRETNGRGGVWAEVQFLAPTPGTNNRTPTSGRIMCVVYTHRANHHRLDVVAGMWGWRYDGFLTASPAPVVEAPGVSGLGAVDLAHLGPETYQHMWQKTRSIMDYLSDHYQDYDYSYVRGDDTHLILQNVRIHVGHLELQLTRNASEPLFSGQLTKTRAFRLYVVGGGGYVLNRSALRKLVNEGMPRCNPRATLPAEDRRITKCLMTLGIFPTDAADALGAHRFHSAVSSILSGGRWEPLLENGI
jgi:glycoprotein-N-acetylgalactosamine 3-beta-galactosyltransferase